MGHARKTVNALGRRVKWCVITLLIYLFRVFPIKDNKILIVNYYGKGYGDNAKYICQQLLESSGRLEIVWALSKLNDDLPSGIKKVKYKSLKYYYDLCTSKVWIDNCRKPLYERKRAGQYYIQTWHGDIGLKKTEGDAVKSLYPSYVKSAKNDSRMADLFISGNEWMINIYRRAYWYNGEIFKCGYPRRDILYTITNDQKRAIKNQFSINEDAHIILYAPTFRKNNDLQLYNIEWNRLLQSLEERFGGEWKGMIRLHPNISRYSDELDLPDRVINVTDYPDMQELLAISDVCITDYSSSALEFAITGKPAFLYACDYSEYKKDRDVHFELDELPFPFSETNQQLINNIITFDESSYQNKREEFYKCKLGLFEEGNASKLLAQRINKICKNGSA